MKWGSLLRRELELDLSLLLPRSAPTSEYVVVVCFKLQDPVSKPFGPGWHSRADNQSLTTYIFIAHGPIN